MAIHEVLEGQSSPPYKRKGSPEESMFSDHSRTRTSNATRGGSYSSSNHHHHHHAHLADHQPRSPRHHRQESPMPQSNSDDDEDSDIRNYKKRRMLKSTTSSTSSSSSINKQSSPPSSSSGSGNGPEVMDQVRTTLKLKQQQKAIIEARQSGAQTPTTSTSAQGASTTSSSSQGSKSKEGTNSTSGGNSQPVTEKNQSGISVFHGSASFAAFNKRPLTSPSKPKNAKSLTIFAPSYSESSLSIHSAPLQPSQGHQGMGMNPRTSQPLRNQTAQHLLQPHPLSQHPHQPSQPLSSISQPLRSPKTAGHAKKSSRAALRPGPHTAGLDNSSGTLPAPILSSHTGPLPSPAMYPHPSTPFHPSNHHSSLSNGPSNHHHVSKPVFMETVSNLFDSVDSTRSLKQTLDEQIRKSAQLLQTLQSSGTMIESLVRGQFKELEKGVIERFENELEYLSARVGQLEEHQGLTPPPKKALSPTTAAASTSSSAMAGIVSTSMPSPPSASSSGATTNGGSEAARHGSESELKDGTLPTPPFNKNQDSAMEIEDEESIASTATSASASPPPAPARDQPAEYNSKVKKLQERVASLEKRQQETTTEA
ncbi:hypothetical protein BG011_005702 [Mortierella polycephala]|uniref:Uncharacterized protein n=1 Tax=Mortierella polycephala TaxID=41804 RepID=A0A9P6QFE4_9FUNG|nr:hypothetical protein BG011_005702 [Mortierella polycephala]